MWVIERVKEGTLKVLGASSLGAGSSDIQLGDTQGIADAALLLDANGLSIGRRITVPVGSTGTATLGAIDAISGGVLTGAITFGKNLILSNAANELTLTGNLSGSNGAALAKTGAGAVAYSSLGVPSFSGGTVIHQGALRWYYNESSTPGNTVSLAFGSGGLTLNGGTFELDVNASSSSGTDTLNFTNPITVTNQGGGLGGNIANTHNSVNFTGTVALAGLLQINNFQSGGGGNPLNYAGTITLDQSAADGSARGLISSNAGGTQTSLVTASIIDGAASAILHGLTLRASSNVTLSPLAANTYAGGTRIEAGGAWIVATGTNCALGSGSVDLIDGSRLRLASPSNSTATVYVGGGSTAQSVLSLAADFLPNLDANSSGSITLDTASNGTSISHN